jgi:transglutaminase-like putative cysteine protease
MKLQRLIAFGMISASAGALAVMQGTREYEGSEAYALLIVLLAGLAATGRFTWNPPQQRRLTLTLALAAIFALKHRFMPYAPKGEEGTLVYGVFSVSYVASQFLLAASVLHMVLPHKWGLSRSTALYAASALLAAGIITPEPRQVQIYRALAVIQVLLMGLFFVSRQTPARSKDRFRTPLAWAMTLLAVAIGVAVAQSAAATMRKYESDVMSLLKYHPLNNKFEGSPGFTDSPQLSSMNFTDRGQGEQLALRIYADQAPGYLRGGAYEEFDGQGWNRRVRQISVRPSPEPLYAEELEKPGAVFRLHPSTPEDVRVMDIWPDPELGAGPFAPLHAAALAAPVDRILVDAHGAIEADDLPGGVNYQVVASGRPLSSAPDAALLNACLHVPDNLLGLVRTIGREIFTPEMTLKEKCRAVEAWFHREYSYSLGLQVPTNYPGTPLEYFLREKPDAHCTYFASAATMLLRSAGVPARLVGGFVAVERNEGGGYWVARQRDAHAWVEAYDAESATWLLVEATPSAGVPEQREASLLAGMWDRLKFQLLRLRVMLHEEGWKGLLRWLGQVLAWLGLALVLTWAGRVVLLIIVVLLARRIIRRLARRLRRARRRRRLDPLWLELVELLASMDRLMARRGFQRRPSETLHRFAARLDAQHESQARWYQRYAAIRYGGQAEAGDLEALREDPAWAKARGG